jgi:hypothetical protein
MHPNSFMIFAAAGAVTLGLARYAGYDVTGVPALDLVFPIWTTICVYTVFSYHPSRPSLDQYLLAVDQKMGASWILGRLFSQYPPLEVICGLAYGTLPFIFVALYLFIPEPANRARLWWSTVISTAVCYIGYSLCPAAGPKYAFTALWPYSEPAMLHPRSDMVQGALNCMPSGHLIGALLFYWFSKTCHKYVRLACAVFLGLTLLATLGLGEHYWIDLIVAFPFASIAGSKTSCINSTCATVPPSDESWKHVFEEPRPLTNGAARPGQAPPPHARTRPGEQLQPLRGAAGRIAENMAASVAIPLATSQRTIAVKVMDENRRIINQHRTLLGRGKVSYTHLIGWAIVKALEESPDSTTPTPNATASRSAWCGRKSTSGSPWTSRARTARAA